MNETTKLDAPSGVGVDAVVRSNVTKNGIEVKPGQVWVDLDPRMNDRHVRVISVDDGKAVVARTNRNTGWTADRTTRLSISRMHKSSTGFALVADS